MRKYILRCLFLLQSVCIFQTGCSHFEPREIDEADKIKEGPGLFTGPDGVFSPGS